MSSEVIAYAVDRKKIKEIYGCKDKDFISDFMSEFSDEIEELAEDFDVNLSDFESRLDLIVNAKPYGEDDNVWIYNSLYEMFCQKHGELIEHEEFMCYLEDAIDDTPRTAFLQIPADKDFEGADYYSIAYEDLDTFKKIFLTKPSYAHEDYYIDEVNTIFDFAKENKRDLVFFAY